MLAHRRPLDQLTPGEYAERFANELTVRHGRGDKFSKSIAVTYACAYQKRGIEPEEAAAAWAAEHAPKPPKPAAPARRKRSA